MSAGRYYLRSMAFELGARRGEKKEEIERVRQECDLKVAQLLQELEGIDREIAELFPVTAAASSSDQDVDMPPAGGAAAAGPNQLHYRPTALLVVRDAQTQTD